jgi:hypothetical protein
MSLKVIGWGGMDWIDLAQERDQVDGSSEHGNKSSGFIKFWNIFAWLGN